MKKIAFLILIYNALFGNDLEIAQQMCRRGDCSVLGYIYQEQGDFLKANQYFEMACKANIGNGCGNLGVQYEYGFGIRQNISLAVKFYDKACNLDSKQCGYLGNMYLLGKGVRQDFCRANSLNLKACNARNAFACWQFGTSIIERRCQNYNIYQAKEYFGKACDLGFQKGCDDYRYLNTIGY
ncbi:sel1 repeat family protein [Campylobacter sp. VBCF_06 NA8]|uniref:tetratricopeptide repeat protein n=1 Tax=Campylobacter sp. VBCF_06 NA8 TaxID=2983822 RepID=UPI0022E9D4E9|nr:tetratricopeptide repeat protein [Campylobacter sp. VBCF_06 NA8]MDA3045958.1 sel1 repeat family protein [Campylobacter sp. VBCF_06 NA8]